jgi:4a-hydroxytetrahydrobiopterin dehydratase
VGTRGLKTIPASDAARDLAGWVRVPGREAISKLYKFKDFNAAFGFMTRAALKAETMDHHPEWTNVYNQVEVILTTHAVEGITELDMALARFMDETAGKA